MKIDGLFWVEYVFTWAIPIVFQITSNKINNSNTTRIFYLFMV